MTTSHSKPDNQADEPEEPATDTREATAPREVEEVETELADVKDRQRDDMFALMDAYYAGMDRAVFESDLDEKHWVIQLFEPASGAVRGF